MKHLGDITRISGYDAEPVDCITFGSPCQDLSVAGKRAGLAGQRSGLFMEAVRIIKEMRWKTNGKYPKFAVWENVPGAFSSNKGDDFRAVLEELIRIVDPAVDVPMPARRKWKKADYFCAGNWSIAYRVFDAQFWGVPQRRRRIALIMDFGGDRAPEILFEREGVPGNFEAGRWTWEAAAGHFVPCAVVPDKAKSESDGLGEKGVGCGVAFTQHSFGDYRKGVGTITTHGGYQSTGETLICAGFNGHKSVTGSIQYQSEIAPTLEANMPSDVLCAGFSGGQGEKAAGIGWELERTPTLRAADSGSNRAPCICIQGNTIDRTARQNGLGIQEDVAYTLDAVDRHGVCCMATGQANAEICIDQRPTLNCAHEQPIMAAAVDCRNMCINPELSATLQAKENGGQSLNYINPVIHIVNVILWIVRRLTPTECERLQGYPDGWTDIGAWRDSKGKLHKESSDSSRYKALGNSIALPQWAWLMGRMAQYLPSGATLGSLFDGIGGFPLVWERIHGKCTARWASEIEEFPIAVTKVRFGHE